MWCIRELFTLVAFMRLDQGVSAARSRMAQRVNVLAWRQVLVLWGATYPDRLWCIRELFTFVAFMRVDQAVILNVMACQQVLVIWLNRKLSGETQALFNQPIGNWDVSSFTDS